jgi:hypothetical protein
MDVRHEHILDVRRDQLVLERGAVGAQVEDHLALPLRVANRHLELAREVLPPVAVAARPHRCGDKREPAERRDEDPHPLLHAASLSPS